MSDHETCGASRDASDEKTERTIEFVEKVGGSEIAEKLSLQIKQLQNEPA